MINLNLKIFIIKYLFNSGKKNLLSINKLNKIIFFKLIIYFIFYF